MRRVLVTGSRNWPDRDRLWNALDTEMLTEVPLTVIHGAADGADYYAGLWGWRRQDYNVRVEAYAADWSRPCDERCYHKPRWRKNGDLYCPMAGHYRNQKMVDLGADVCLAFPLEDSLGTQDCMRRAKKAGIEVVNYGWGGERCCDTIGYHATPHRGCFLR